MNTQSNVVSESSLESQAIASPATTSLHLYWSVRRELWESRWTYIAPLCVAGLYLFGFLISVIHLPTRMHQAVGLSAVEQHDVIEQPTTLPHF